MLLPGHSNRAVAWTGKPARSIEQPPRSLPSVQTDDDPPHRFARPAFGTYQVSSSLGPFGRCRGSYAARRVDARRAGMLRALNYGDAGRLLGGHESRTARLAGKMWGGHLPSAS